MCRTVLANKLTGGHMRAFRTILMALVLLISHQVFAGDVTGKVSRIYVMACPSATRQSDCAVAIVKLSVAASNTPASSSAGGNGLEWAFWINSPPVKAILT